MSEEFNLEKQKLLLEYMLSEENIFLRAHNILNPEYFDTELKKSVEYILNHSQSYNALPTPEQVRAETGIELNLIPHIRDADVDWALENIESFCKRQAIIAAVIKSSDLIPKGAYGEVEKSIKDALEISLQKDLGTDYFLNPRERLEKMRQVNLIPTGWRDFDSKLYGGLNRGEVTIFAAASGMGKSLFLQNLCLNWVFGPVHEYNGKLTKHDPLNVVYITLELSEELTSKRLDTMITGIHSKDIFKRLDDVELKVRMASKKAGMLIVKYMPAGTTANDIKAYLKELEIKTGKKIDALAVDYLDLMHPNGMRINPSDLFIKDKYVTEELRSLLAELNILGATASQLNRSAVDEADHNHAMIAGGISKIQTADNVVSIYATPGMKERGEYQLQFLKTRSSSGVGSKITLAFDNVSLRISNHEEAYMSDDQDDSSSPMTPGPNLLRNKISKIDNDDVINRIKVQRPVPPKEEPKEDDNRPNDSMGTTISLASRLDKILNGK